MKITKIPAANVQPGDIISLAEDFGYETVLYQFKRNNNMRRIVTNLGRHDMQATYQLWIKA